MSKEDLPNQDATDIEMTDAESLPQPSSSSTNTTKSSKRKKTAKQTTLSQFTIRNPPWSYIHLSRLASPSSTSLSAPEPLDALTAQIQLQAALSSFLGLHGTAIPIDFLNIEGQRIWARVPREDVSAVVAAVGGWVGKNGEGWRVIGWGCWGPDLGRDGGGQHLFDD